MRYIPNKLLLVITAVFVIPCATLAVFGGPLAGIAVFVPLLILIVSAFDILVSSHLLNGLNLESKELVRCTKGKELSIPLNFVSKGVPLSFLRLGLKVPDEFSVVGKPVSEIKGIPADTLVRFDYCLLPLKRGQYFFDNCYVETTSRFGFWLIRGKLPMDVEVRTYPDLSGERRRLSALFLLIHPAGESVLFGQISGHNYHSLILIK